MKRKITLLFVLCTLFFYREILAQGNGATITIEESRCVATGVITATNVQGTGPFIYDFIDYPVDYAYTGPTASNVLSALNPGNYTLRIIDQGAGNSFTDYPVSVPGDYIEPDYNLTATDVTGCYNATNGSIAGTLVNGRAPFLYEIIAGPMGVGTTNNTGTFINLGAGTYTIRGYDSCGNFQTRQATINNYFWGIGNPVVAKVGCGQYSFNSIDIQINPGMVVQAYTVKNGGNIIATGPSLPLAFSNPDATIGNVQVCVTDPCGTEQCTSFGVSDWTVGGNSVSYPTCNNFTVNSIDVIGSPIGPVMYGIERAPGDTIWSATLPFNFVKVAQGYFFATVFVKDGCGVIKASGNQQFVNMWGDANYNYTSCTESQICHSNSWFYINPVNYSLNGGASQANNCFTNLTDGVYTILATDACGSTIERTVNVDHSWALSGGGASTSCTMGKTYTSFYIPGNVFSPLVTQRYDAGFNLIGANPMPYTSGNQWTFDDNLEPNTTYNYIVTDNCGRIDTVTITTGAGSTPLTHSTTVTPLCVNHGNINATSSSDHGGYLGSEIGLLNGPAITGNNYYGNQGGPFTVYYNNLDTGRYWVKYYASYCANDVFYDTVQIEKYVLPKMRKSIAFNCPGNTVNIVGSVKGGLAPYTYEVVQTFPVNNPVPPQASNLFTLAGTYTLVRLRVVDACGNSSLQDIAVRPPAQPTMKITAKLPVCNLSAFSLYVDSTIAGQTYEWKNPGGNVIGTGPMISLNNLTLADTGLYSCRVMVPGTCLDVNTTFRLRAKDFGCYASLGNYVWLDTDKDGAQDNNEVGVSGITVTLFDNNNQVVAATVTDAYGLYLFDNLLPGTYHVGFTLPTNYVFTGKDLGGNDTGDSDADLINGMTGNYTLQAGDSNMTVDAGIFFEQPANASLGDYVWYDADQDGVQDANEVGISGVTVTLNDQAGNPIATTVTDASGHYYFVDLVPGTYSVTFTKPIGYIFSPQNQGDDQKDSDVDIVTGKTGNVTLAPGENNLTIDAGLYAQSNVAASLGNYVWNDTDHDGLQDASETGVAGVLVTLYGEDGVTVVGTTYTDEFGYYIFNNLTPGDYVVGFSNLPPGYVFSDANNGNNDAVDSDPDGVSGKTGNIHLTAGEKNLTVDAGIYNPTLPTGALGNYVWYDYDKDGVQDEIENGVPGVTVTLYDNANNILAVTSTDASGHYLFDNLGAGNYVVGFSNIPPGYKLTTTDQGGNDATDSDPSAVDGKTAVIALGLGEVNLTVDAGIVNAGDRTGTATLGDRVWYDDNNNGIQDNNEFGVSGVTVTLYAADGVTVLKTQITDALGNYLFTGLDAGGYIVGFSNLPAGFTFSNANQGADDELDADADAGSGGKTGLYTLAEGQDDLSVDAGIHAAAGLASLGNYVWNDLNLDGIQDANEPGVPGITVSLYDGAGVLQSVTTTDANGLYQFTGLVPGNYYVEFSNLPAGYEFTGKDAGANTLEAEDSDADPITGATEWVNLVAGQNYPDLDAGIYTELAGLGNYVWNDYNNDGIQDANEPGIPGITVILYAADGVTPLASAITDENGHYSFVNLTPDTYIVGFSNIPAGANFSGQNQGADDALDSDADPASGKTGPITLDAGEYNPTIDAGIHVPQGAGLGNYVWFDADADGIQDASETGVGGVTVTLYDQAGNAIQLSITDQTGFYSFPNLSPGTYSVGFSTIPPNLGFTQNNAGANDSLDNDVVNIISNQNGLPISGQTAQVTIVAGEYNPTIDAGLKTQFPLGVAGIEASATLNGTTAAITWFTSDEKNVKVFDLERSTDNKEFTHIANMVAKGNTVGRTDYKINDDVSELMHLGVLYYRIKMFDVNGQYLYSNTVYVNPSRTENEEVVLFPTPFVSEVNVGYLATESTVLEIELTDAKGSVVKKQSVSIEAGQNRILIKDLGTLASGNYFIKIQDINLNKTFVKKLSKK